MPSRCTENNYKDSIGVRMDNSNEKKSDNGQSLDVVDDDTEEPTDESIENNYTGVLGANEENNTQLEWSVKHLIIAVNQLRSIVEKQTLHGDSSTDNLQEYKDCLSACETIIGDPIAEATESSLKLISAAVEEGMKKISMCSLEQKVVIDHTSDDDIDTIEFEDADLDFVDTSEELKEKAAAVRSSAMSLSTHSSIEDTHEAVEEPTDCFDSNFLFHKLKKRKDVPTYSADCYSFMAIYSPFEGPPIFYFGLMVFLFQMTFLLTMFTKSIVKGQVDNPFSEEDDMLARLAPANVDRLVRMIQVLAALSSLIFADAPLMDCFHAIEKMPHLYQHDKGIRIWQVWMASVFRFVQGFTATMVSLLLIMNTDNVVEIVLNFTAVNFISTLDNTAFELAKSGNFGRVLEREATLIDDRPIRYRIYRFQVLHVHVITLLLVGIPMLSVMMQIIFKQSSKDYWFTKQYRVEFKNSNELEQYNGCYIQSGDFVDRRHRYNSYSNNSIPDEKKHMAFGYCTTEFRWILFVVDDNNTIDGDPCDIPDENIRARSGITYQFDIFSSFDGGWTSVTDAALDVDFISVTDSMERCTSFKHDGKCDDKEFNTFEYDYDGGDCCSWTCDNDECGRGGASGAFGIDDIPGIGFRNCEDPDMKPLVVNLSNISSSRERYRSSLTKENETKYFEEKNIQYWSETPSTTDLQIRCDGKNVLVVYIDRDFEGSNETIWVKDGAKCIFDINNSTNSVEEWDNDPFWMANYAIYSESAEIISGFSGTDGRKSFKLFRSCYLEILDDYLDPSTIYTSTSDSVMALNWVSNPRGDSLCDDKLKLVERFALAALYFAAPVKEKSIYFSKNRWINEDGHCLWDSTLCREGRLERLSLREKDLDGTISTSIGLLTGLNKLVYDQNGLIGTIPTELGLLTKLTYLDIDKNKLYSTIPSELGKLTNMEELDLDNNELIGTIPIEFFSMSNLYNIELQQNKLSGSIPSEVRQLSNVRVIMVHDNTLTGTFPIELTNITHITKLKLSNNNMDGSIPTEIGLLTSLVELDLQGNSFTGSVPSEIGLLKELKYITLNGNKFTGLPSQLGLLTSLVRMDLWGNLFTGQIPSEIESLAKLKNITLDGNKFTGTFPTASLEKMKSLTHDDTGGW